MENKPADGTPTTRDVWLRGLFMLLFMIAFAIGQSILNLIAIVQFLWLMFAREHNQLLANFGNSLATWLAEVGRFLACAADDRPFPWKPWPAASAASGNLLR
jgi:hypothetical protein